jgi:hypothetical protein
MLEKNIVARIMKYLKTLPNAYFEKKWAGAANPGDPDISGCIQGRCVKLEVKREGNEPTPRQAAKLRAWEKAGAISAVVRSVEDVKEVLHEYV